jgi:hypothetical protein
MKATKATKLTQENRRLTTASEFSRLSRFRRTVYESRMLHTERDANRAKRKDLDHKVIQPWKQPSLEQPVSGGHQRLVLSTLCGLDAGAGLTI